MDVNFEYYKIFYYVAKYHNFTKAAQALNNSQPNITRAMNCLEQRNCSQVIFCEVFCHEYGKISRHTEQNSFHLL